MHARRFQDDAQHQGQQRRESGRGSDAAEGDHPVGSAVKQRDETEHRGDHEAGAEPHQHASHPDEHGHVGCERQGDLSDGAQQDADAEGPLPPDDRAHKASRDHERASDERIDHVGELDFGGGGMELLGERRGGKRQGAVVAGRSHLRQDEDDDGDDEELLFACGRIARLGRLRRRRCGGHDAS